MKKMLTVMSGIALSVILFAGTPTVSMAYTQTTGIVSATAAKVRKEPSTESDVVAGLLKGSSVTVTDEVTDSVGALWYKVTVDGSSGYIRSDLLLKANPDSSATGTAAGSNTTSAGSTASNAGGETSKTQVKEIADTKAYVNFESARVREGASTKHEIVGSAVKNTPVTITGEAKATDGKLWYQVKYTNSSGREVVGFIRSDLLTIGEAPAAPETTQTETVPETEQTPEQPPEGEMTAEGTEGEEAAESESEPEPEPQPEVVEKPDYEMVYTANNEGVDEWYLYDNINGTRQTLAGLMAAAEAATKLSAEKNEQASTQKIIIIVLAVAAAVLAVAVIFLLFKLKDMYDDSYEAYEDDEEEEEEEEEEPIIRKKRAAPAVKTEKPQEPESPVGIVKEKSVQTVKKAEPRLKEEKADMPAAERSQPKRKAKNFLIDDDEFEFEFLNMDDKK